MPKHSVLTMSRGDAHRLREWVEYHSWLGFDDFHIILDNPNDDSERVLRGLDVPAKITIQVMPAHDEYYDGLEVADRWERVRAWRERNASKIADWGLPIVDSLSMRQYLYLPAAMNKYALRGEGWISIIDVDEFIALPDGRKITDVTAGAKQPRLRFLNFNFDTTGDDPRRPVLDQHTRRWSREDVVSHGGGWDNRVKSIVRYDSMLPLRSVHAISGGGFEILDPHVGRLHHYKATDQGLPIPYSVEDETLVSVLPDSGTYEGD